MQLPEIATISEQLRRHKEKEGYTTAQLVTQLEALGWTWQAALIDDILAGRVKPTGNQTLFFQRYLLNKFLAYNRS